MDGYADNLRTERKVLEDYTAERMLDDFEEEGPKTTNETKPTKELMDKAIENRKDRLDSMINMISPMAEIRMAKRLTKAEGHKEPKEADLHEIQELVKFSADKLRNLGRQDPLAEERQRTLEEQVSKISEYVTQGKIMSSDNPSYKDFTKEESLVQDHRRAYGLL